MLKTEVNKKDSEIELDITSIIVGDRFRQDFGDIAGLAASIEKHGLVHAISIDEEYKLIAGERRFKAHTLLGKSTIRCRILAGLSEIQKKEIEIEENLQRKSFTWQEDVRGKEIIHNLKQAIYGKGTQGHKSKGWTITDTAQALGESIGTVSMDVQLAEGLRLYPQLNKETKKTVAFKKYKGFVERDLRRKLAEVTAGDATSVSELLLCGDCITLIDTIASESVDLVVTDPPYGINLDKRACYVDRVDVYSDVPQEVDDNIDLLVRSLYRVMKPDSHLYLFFPITKFQWTKDILEKVGFTVCEWPLIWDKQTFTYVPGTKWPALSYESIIFAIKGDKKLTNPIMASFQVDKMSSTYKIHPVERPLQLLRIFIEASSEKGDLVFDPFAGSASTLIAALELGRRCLGIEKDIVYHQKATERISDLQSGKRYTRSVEEFK